jgi:SRSO17 transposase
VFRATNWEKELGRWFEPFGEALGHKVRRKWAPIYVQGLIAPGERKSVVPLSERVAHGDAPQLHHFVADSKWETGPLEDVLVDKAAGLVGGPGSHLIVDDTALPKKGTESVGVAHQYCGALGKQANCQSLVSVTWARDEVPIPIALRLYLPKDWAESESRRAKAQVPASIAFRAKWEIALDEIRRIKERTDGAFDDVLADAGYGMVAQFRRGLDELDVPWVVGILSTQNVYSPEVQLDDSPGLRGRPRKYPRIDTAPVAARDAIEASGSRAFRSITWRRGTKGPLRAKFAAIRVRPADGPRQSRGVHPPGNEAWLICELRTSGERKYYLSNYGPKTSLKKLAALIKARWSCEQAHQQMKEELGLDHFEGRSWGGLHHHAVLTMIAFAFLQHQRVRQNKASAQPARRHSAGDP